MKISDTGLVETVTVETIDGEVEYDAVTCSVCGERVQPDDAIPVGLGHDTDRCPGRGCHESHATPDKKRAVCEACSGGLFDYEPSGYYRASANWYMRRSPLSQAVLLVLVWGVLTALWVML